LLYKATLSLTLASLTITVFDQDKTRVDIGAAAANSRFIRFLRVFAPATEVSYHLSTFGALSPLQAEIRHSR